MGGILLNKAKFGYWGMAILIFIAFAILVMSPMIVEACAAKETPTPEPTAEAEVEELLEAVPIVGDLLPILQSEQTEQLETPQQMYVLGDHVWVRSQPSATEGNRIEMRQAGEIVIVTSKTGEWCQIGENQYMHESMLTANRSDIVKHFLENYQDLVVVDITMQHVTYYWYSEVVAEGDCVTGDAYASPTPIGLYPCGTKDNDFDMNHNPANHVQWATYFNQRIALHDADNWRNAYGGSIYQGSGSHGCVNVGVELAKYVYDHARTGYTYFLVLP